MQQFWIKFLSASIGNLLDHYSKALFLFLAPFLAPIFFADASPLSALILTYAIMPLSLFVRPVGALYFGLIGDRRGRCVALFLTLSGVALSTFLIGCLPTYRQVGWFAPVLFSLGYLTQTFFASGETVGGTLLILEACEKSKRTLYNSIYECSTLLGGLLASLGATWLSVQESIETYWRWLYWMGGGTGGIAFVVRLLAKDTIMEVQPKRRIPSFLWKHRTSFLIVAVTSGFSYANYYLVTSLLNSFLPLISSVTRAKMMQTNSLILICDCLLLPLGGFLATQLPKEKLMIIFASSICILILPLYSLLATATFPVIILIRMVFVVLGVGFSVILTPYYQDLIPHENRYTLICFGTAIGSQLFGSSACSVGLFLFRQTSWPGAPALYLIAVGFLVVTLLAFKHLKSHKFLVPELSNKCLEGEE